MRTLPHFVSYLLLCFFVSYAFRNGFKARAWKGRQFVWRRPFLQYLRFFAKILDPWYLDRAVVRIDLETWHQFPVRFVNGNVRNGGQFNGGNRVNATNGYAGSNRQASPNFATRSASPGYRAPVQSYRGYNSAPVYRSAPSNNRSFAPAYSAPHSQNYSAPRSYSAPRQSFSAPRSSGGGFSGSRSGFSGGHSGSSGGHGGGRR
jgi:hypothetical protein